MLVVVIVRKVIFLLSNSTDGFFPSSLVYICFLGSMLPQYLALSVCVMCVCLCQKNSRRLRFGMLTVLTNIRSTEVS